jgi:hypothetical protein
MNQRVLLFSRGKGRGHAIPDAAVAADVIARKPSVDVTFASDSTGLATLRDLGCRVIDLERPEANPLSDTVSRVIALLRQAHQALAQPLCPIHRQRRGLQRCRRDPGQRSAPAQSDRHARRPSRFVAHRNRRYGQRRGLRGRDGGSAHSRKYRRQATSDDPCRAVDRRRAGLLRFAWICREALRQSGDRRCRTSPMSAVANTEVAPIDSGNDSDDR